MNTVWLHSRVETGKYCGDILWQCFLHVDVTWEINLPDTKHWILQPKQKVEFVRSSWYSLSFDKAGKISFTEGWN